MNFRRIEWILAISFIVIDLFLLTLLAFRNTSMNQNDGAVEPIDVVQKMATEKITLSFTPNEKEESSSMLSAEASTYGEDGDKELKEEVDDGVTLDLPTNNNVLNEASLTRLDNFIKENVQNGRDYHFVAYDQKNRQIIYEQNTAYGGDIVGEVGKLILYLDKEGKVIEYHQRHLEKIQAQGRKRTLISQQRAINVLYMNDDLADGTSIRSANLGYKEMLTVKDVVVLQPVWQVVVLNRDKKLQIHYVDALNETVIEDNPTTENQEEG